MKYVLYKGFAELIAHMKISTETLWSRLRNELFLGFIKGFSCNYFNVKAKIIKQYFTISDAAQEAILYHPYSCFLWLIIKFYSR